VVARLGKKRKSCKIVALGDFIPPCPKTHTHTFIYTLTYSTYWIECSLQKKKAAREEECFK
jgi:hypothetical protein